MDDSENLDPAGPNIESLTHCQANTIRVEVMIVTSNPEASGPGMKSLTVCQANRIRAVGVMLDSEIGPN